MRLYPPAHTIARTALGEDRIGGVRVPAGAIMTINIYVTHRNPNLWPEPERFDPARFAPAEVAKRHRFAYLPFGGGPRICAGRYLALLEIKLAITVLLHGFEIESLDAGPGGIPSEEMTSVVGPSALTLRLRAPRWKREEEEPPF